MIEVFKTDVRAPAHAAMLVEQIREADGEYIANFDLQDCDNILRVKCLAGDINSDKLVNLLKEFGFHAEVLPDSALPLHPPIL